MAHVALAWLLAATTLAVPMSAVGIEDETVDRLRRFWITTSAGAVDSAQTPSADVPGTLTRTRLAKASPDECFDGIGQPYPRLTSDVDGSPLCVDPATLEPRGVPKVNEAYVWGLVEANDKLWFGTAANVHCLVTSAFAPEPHETSAWVCEFGESQLSPPMPPQVGDWRPPHFYTYDLVTDTLTKITPADLAAALTLGIRSAGQANGVVFLGGPALLGGVNLFAFDAHTAQYLGSRTLPVYGNIRKWVNVGDALYTGVGKTAGGGAVLRWVGNRADPFRFEVVGDLDAEAAELAVHDGSLFVSTWPQIGSAGAVAGLWMSPAIGKGGLTSADAQGWMKVWDVLEYEPDLVTAFTYGGGALQSFDGYLYWGTMHVPMMATFAHTLVYGSPETPEQLFGLLLGTHRAISVFRGRNFRDAAPLMEVVYGMLELPAYVPGAGGGTWELRPTGMGEAIWGPSGFGNMFNNYTWNMAVAKRQLFIGTMDWSYLVAEGLAAFLPALGGVALDPAVVDAIVAALQSVPLGFGADLLRIGSSQTPGEFESVAGVGNYTSYGVRTSVTKGRVLFLGMANPMNLLTDPNDDRPEGGWELLSLTAPPCTVSPLAGCWAPTSASGASLSVNERGRDAADMLTWKWSGAGAMGAESFGDPTKADDYALCIYAGSAATLVLEAQAPAGGTCGTKPCWKPLGENGFKYTDAERTPDGLFQVVLRLMFRPYAARLTGLRVAGSGLGGDFCKLSRFQHGSRMSAEVRTRCAVRRMSAKETPRL